MKALANYALLIVLISFNLDAKINVEKSKNKRSISSDKESLARSNFLNFIGCQRFTMNQDNHKALLSCMSQFLHPTVSKAEKDQYVQFFQMAGRITEPYLCDQKTSDIPKALKEEFDTILCFDSIGKNTNEMGILLFKNEKLVPMLLKIKI
jgi:hypothetical protein